jgi:hypothetical protein
VVKKYVTKPLSIFGVKAVDCVLAVRFRRGGVIRLETPIEVPFSVPAIGTQTLVALLQIEPLTDEIELAVSPFCPTDDVSRALPVKLRVTGPPVVVKLIVSVVAEPAFAAELLLGRFRWLSESAFEVAPPVIAPVISISPREPKFTVICCEKVFWPGNPPGPAVD